MIQTWHLYAVGAVAVTAVTSPVVAFGGYVFKAYLDSRELA